MKPKQISAVQRIFKGLDYADTVIKNGKIINVFTNEIELDKVVAIKNGTIFYVGEYKTDFVGPSTDIIDADNLFLAPGFIDAHTHLDSMIPYPEFVEYALKGGTTCVVTECAMVANALGVKGVKDFVNSTKEAPLKTLFLAPPLVPPVKRYEISHPFSFKDFETLLKRKDFVGIGEAYWNEAIRNEGGYFKKVELANIYKKSIEGHAAGAKGKNLFAYLNCGITSCHESITIDEAIEKLRQGIFVMIREGYIRSEMQELSKLKNFTGSKERIILVSDVFNAAMLMEGYLNVVVRKAITFGFNPVDAIKMVTINPATYFGFNHLGAISIGRSADILFLSDLKDVKITKVMIDGSIVVEKGNYLLPKQNNSEKKPKNSLSLRKIKEADILIKSNKSRRVRVMEIFSPTIMKESFAIIKPENSVMMPDLSRDIIPVFLIDRRTGVKNMGKGFIKGIGMKRGAVATTLIWDTCNILALGTSYADIVFATNRLIELGGGWVVAKNSKIIFEFPMPLYGLISTMTIPQIAKKESQLENALRKLGSKMERPYLNLQTIAFTGLPFLRLTNRGLLDMKTMRKVALF